MSRRLFALAIIAGASIPVVIALLLWRAESRAADPAGGSSTFLVEARTGMSHGRPIWVCTYGYGRQTFERAVFVSEGSCPPSAESR